jgi:hypothetical protein
VNRSQETKETREKHEKTMAAADPFDWPTNNENGRQLRLLEESLLCPICSEYFENPHSINCGHSFCSMCIRKHLDRNFNVITFNQCPMCREKADTSQLRPNRSLGQILDRFKASREGLLGLVRSSNSSSSSAGVATTTTTTTTTQSIPSSSSIASAAVTFSAERNGLTATSSSSKIDIKFLPQKVFFKYTKDKLRKELTQLCQSSTGNDLSHCPFRREYLLICSWFHCSATFVFVQFPFCWMDRWRIWSGDTKN